MAGYRVGTECIPCFNCTHPRAFSPVAANFQASAASIARHYQKLCAPTMHLYFPGVRDIQKTLPLRNAENLVKHANLIFLKDKKTTTISIQQQQDCWRNFFSIVFVNLRVKSLVSRGLLSQDVRSCFKRRPFVQPACSCILYDCSLPKFYPRHSFVLCGLRALAKVFPAPISTQMCKVHARDANAVFHHFMRIKPELKEMYLKI